MQAREERFFAPSFIAWWRRGQGKRGGLFGAVGDERRQERELVWSSRKEPLLKFLSLVSDNRLSTGKSSFATYLSERYNMEAPALCGQVAREGEANPWHMRHEDGTHIAAE